MIAIHEIIDCLEQWAPGAYQEDYDNSGLLTGRPEWDATSALITLDCTEEVVDEAIHLKSNLILAHHPIIFRGLKRLTGSSYVERTIIKALRNNIAIYALHTNLDHVRTGVNKKIADHLGLTNQRILLPRKNTLSKLVTFLPPTHVQQVLDALHAAGAGNIGNYADCSFRVEGEGTFKPTHLARPFIGKEGERERTPETRIEVILPTHLEQNILSALRATHPYEEIAYYLNRLENDHQDVGAGLVGELPSEEEPMAFLRRLKSALNTAIVRHTKPLGKPIRRVALCGGSGSFLLQRAIHAKADVFVSADFKYHEFFDSDGKIIIADVGHYESEQFTKELIGEVLREKFPTFAINFSKQVTNPLSYL